MSGPKRCSGLLVLPHLRIQNANAIASPLTHGFPAMTAFLGHAWALGRRLQQAAIALRPLGVGVICHAHQEQANDAGYVRTFNLSRNPVGQDGATAAIVEEGRIHLDLTLVIGVTGHGVHDPLLQDDAARQDVANQVHDIVATMRLAGGSVLPALRGPGRRTRPELIRLAEDPAQAATQFRQLRRTWLPGFALVGRDDLLAQRLARLRQQRPGANALDALLDLSRFNWRPVAPDDQVWQGADAKQRWQHDHQDGWIVPIPVGYGALSELYPAGTVRRARDASTRMRFVESLYSVGQWIAPHRLASCDDLLWFADHAPETGLYRCRNHYRPQATLGADLSPAGNDDIALDDELISFPLD